MGDVSMNGEFQDILEQVRAKGPAMRKFEAEGTEYVRYFRPRERLILLGGGHIAQPVCRYAADLGFSVTVVDDRPSFASHPRFPEAEEVLCDAFPAAIEQLDVSDRDYVCVITRGHRCDGDCLRAILAGAFPKYLGMIGSRRRVAGLLQLLEEEGFSRAALERIHAPIGLDIGALTVKEIAVSIVAQLIQVRRAGLGRQAKSAVLTAEDIDLPLLEFLTEYPGPKALMTVVETQGSTPVKSGAMMAVGQDCRTVGTIGGGCGESAVLRDAYRLMGTGQSRCVTVDMSSDMAAEEGMVCGGRMKVLIEDVPRGQPKKDKTDDKH
jgi:xanthine dehydrogenase accessory factor